MKDPYFFGYGSLVNSRSHTYPDARPAKINGWRRAWVATPRFGNVLLTSVPSPGHSIHGVIAAVPGADWTALDARESGYARLPASHEVEHDHPHEPDIAIYSVAPENLRERNGHVILLSYLDVVAQGFHDVLGEEGMQHFFDTTDGWETPVVNDRVHPVYPRHQKLTGEQRALVDDHLSRLSVTVLSRDDVPDSSIKWIYQRRKLNSDSSRPCRPNSCFG